MKLSLILALFLTLSAWAAPKDLSQFVRDEGPYLNLQTGSYLQGSVVGGGTQPDYFIDADSPELQKLWVYAHRVRASDIGIWWKIQKIEKYIREKVLVGYSYDDFKYTQLINKYRKKGKDVPISQYAVCQAGVCRENGILLHLALKEAGIDNRYVYAEIHRASSQYDFDIIEDHAFCVLNYKGEDWVVDSYYWGFDGFLLKDLMRPQGITEFSRHAPTASPAPGFRNIIKLHNYPAWHPRPACHGIYH